MADDLDQLIRTAMKTLDDEVPSGYFEALPNQTIARLEGSSMQHGSSGSTETRDTVVSPPPVRLDDDAPVSPASRDQAREEDREDSGLHDIRNLAQSTKQRLSSKRITQSPPIADDVLASSSGSFKNIALPQPAKMVSLPELDELPTKAEMDKAAEKAAKEAAKQARKSRDKIEVVAPAAAVEAPAATPVIEKRQAFSLPSQQKKSNKGPLLALLGTGLAAAAGYVIFMQVNKAEDKASMASAPAETAKDMTAAPSAGAAATAPTVEPIAPPPAAEPPPAPPVEEPKQEAAAQLAADNVAEEKADDKARAKKTKPGKGGKADKEEPKTQKVDAAPEKVETKKPADTTKKGSGEEGEPSFDALLKEAGVSEKKEAKPVLDKKSLTGDDFKKAMAAVTPKAKGCYNGTQGTATVKLTVAPSGSISKVSVGGDFAGKPEAACIESAIRGATFPPWDGGPQSFSYAVLLSD
jgi:hypothetical protein